MRKHPARWRRVHGIAQLTLSSSGVEAARCQGLPNFCLRGSLDTNAAHLPEEMSYARGFGSRGPLDFRSIIPRFAPMMGVGDRSSTFRTGLHGYVVVLHGLANAAARTSFPP